MKKIIEWDDIDCTVRLEMEEISMRFEVFEVQGMAEGDEPGVYCVPLYERKGAESSNDNTESLDEAQPLLRGSIGWDACSHVYFGDNGYIHLCGGRSWLNFMEATKRIWEIAKKELPKEHSKDMFDLDYSVPCNDNKV